MQQVLSLDAVQLQPQLPTLQSEQHALSWLAIARVLPQLVEVSKWMSQIARMLN